MTGVLTCTVVVCIKHGKQGADGEDVIVLVEIHLEGLMNSSQPQVQTEWLSTRFWLHERRRNQDEAAGLYVRSITPG